MLKLNIQNFRNIRSLDMTDEGKLTILVGYNESGKSSLKGAIKFAFCGEAFGHKGKDVGTLITHGESRMSVRVQVNDLLVYRTSYDTGDSLTEIAKNLKAPKDVVPLLFDSEMAGDGGNKAMRAYLTGVAEDQFDPSVHFVKDDAIRGCADLAKRAGKLQVKAIVAYCEDQRAQHKTPPKPTPPQIDRPTEGQIAKVKADLESAVTTLATTKAELAEAQSLSRDLSQIANHVKALSDYQVKLATVRTDDPLGARRQALDKLANVNLKTLDAIEAMLRAAGYEAAGLNMVVVKVELAAIVAEAQKILGDNPAPDSAPVQPVEPACFADYQRSLEAGGKTISEQLPGLLAQAANAVFVCTERNQSAQQTKDAAQAASDQMQRLIGGWNSYDAVNTDYAAKAQRAEVEWAKWNHAAKEIQAAHTNFLTQQSQRFSNIISDMGAAVLGGRKLAIDITNGITLGGLPIEEVSLSTRWRMEVSVMTAVARSLNSPLLVIDGADILDRHNRNIMTSFLMEHVVPHFKHVILTMTAKDDIAAETPLEHPASRWIINNGSVHKL
ncbi:MAG: AAA family ATPase [Phycisphaerae bacterium]|jgi:hypothetical protein